MPIYLATERVNVGLAAPHWLPIGCDLRDVFWRDRRWLWLHHPGQSPTEALVWFREPQADPRLLFLTDDPTETISKTASDWLTERCADGRPLDPAKTFAELLLDILISPPANGSFGRPLVSDKRDQQYKLWLGPRDAGPVATKLDPIIRTASIAWADNCNRSGNLGGSGVSAGAASWVALDQDQSPAWQTDGAQVRSGQVGNGCYDRYSAHLDTDTDSDDQYAQADVTWVSAGVNKNVGGVVVRMAGAYGNEGYSAEIGNEAGTEVWALKFWTDGSGLDSGTNSGSPKTLYLEFNGSNWDLKINGSSVSTGGNSSFTGHLRVGIFSITSSESSSDARIDNFAGGDIGASPPPDNISGSGDVTLPVSELNGDGQVDIFGTGDVTLPVSSLAGVGMVEIRGTGDVTFVISALAGSGVVQVSGTGSMTFVVSGLSGSGTAVEPIDTAMPYKHFEEFSNVEGFLDLR